MYAEYNVRNVAINGHFRSKREGHRVVVKYKMSHKDSTYKEPVWPVKADVIFHMQYRSLQYMRVLREREWELIDDAILEAKLRRKENRCGACKRCRFRMKFRKGKIDLVRREKEFFPIPDPRFPLYIDIMFPPKEKHNYKKNIFLEDQQIFELYPGVLVIVEDYYYVRQYVRGYKKLSRKKRKKIKKARQKVEETWNKWVKIMEDEIPMFFFADGLTKL